MKISDLQIGVEYCETAPLAYGQEPHTVNPTKIRILSKVTGWGWLTVHHAEQNPNERQRERNPIVWKRASKPTLINPKLQPEWDGKQNLPSRAYAYRTTGYQVGATVETFEPVRGAVEGEAYNFSTQEWDKRLIQPAAIHRTWEAYEKGEEERRYLKQQQELAQAPLKVDHAVRQLVENGLLTGLTLGDMLIKVETAYDLTKGIEK